MKPRHLLPLLSLALLLVLGACDLVVAGFNATTTIDAEGAGTFVVEIGFVLEEDDDTAECGSSEELPPGATVTTEFRGNEQWCVITLPFNDLSGLRTMYGELLGEALVVHCLDYSGAQVIYDAELLSEETLEQPLVWRVAVPGLIESHNGDEADVESVTWQIYGTTRMQINIPESGYCPSQMIRLSVFVNEDGTGSARLTVPTIDDTESNEVVAQWLRDDGWAVSGDTSGEASSPLLGQRSWQDETGFTEVFTMIPGMEGNPRGMSLEILEDSATGQTEYTMEGRLKFDDFDSIWGGLWRDREPPPFFFEYLPPGVTSTVLGEWTDPELLVYLRPPGGSESASFRVVSVYQPEVEMEVDEATRAENEAYILDQFFDEIPDGQIIEDPSYLQSALSAVFGAGTANNMTNWTEYACGDYQTRVIAMLDAIRTHPDPEVRARLAGLDYGPVQAYNGGHQAVVLFPRGTDWNETATVLDPWPSQRPDTYTIQEWKERFSWGHGPGEGANEYPHLFGNPPHYAGTPIPRAREHPRRIGVNSPVAVMLVAADGRRLGMDESGEFVNEIEHADFYPTPKGDGEYQWYFGLPEGEYEVTFTGTTDGDVHILVGDEHNSVVTYGAIGIENGEQFNLGIGDSTGITPLEKPDGAVDPFALTDSNVDSFDLGPAAEATAGVPDLSDLLTARNIGFAVAGLGALIACVIVPVLAAGFFIFSRRKRSQG